MQIIAETHSHTVACDHAYSTIYENVCQAARVGLKFLCVTEHGPAMPGAPGEMYFGNMPKVVPDFLEGVAILKGVESNILDYCGRLDLSEKKLAALDWVIASYHINCVEPSTPEEHTAGWLAVAKNPHVDVIGHAGDDAHSFECRPKSDVNCREIARCCKKYGVRVVCSSDAHFFTQIARVDESIKLLRELDFPEELILNANYERFLAAAREKSGRSIF